MSVRFSGLTTSNQITVNIVATYEESGVNISAGEETVDRIKSIVRETYTPGVISDIGAFGAFFAPDFTRYEEPVLVSSVDGVGTKLKVAVIARRFDSVGQDLVNHCVNDIAVCGADPLFFMDYFATGSLDPDMATSVISGFALACRENGCALIGGEIAEMPGIYHDGDFDLAGTIVGMVDRNGIIDGSGIEGGDILIGLPSNGLHTNGYSLARRVLLEHFEGGDRPDELEGLSVADEMLRVHRSYLSAIRALKDNGLARGLAHVTGGGIVGNTERVIPDGLQLDVDWGSWEEPAVFKLIRRLGDVPEEDMRRTFNLGIGLVAIVAPSDAERAGDILESAGFSNCRIGVVRPE